MKALPSYLWILMAMAAVMGAAPARADGSDGYARLKAQEKEVLDDLKQNAWDKAVIERDRIKAQTQLDHSETADRRRAIALEEAAKRKVRARSRKIASVGAEQKDPCDDACRPGPACKFSDFASVATLDEKDRGLFESPNVSATTKHQLFEKITQGEPRACLYLYHRSQKKLYGISDECLAAVSACPSVKKDQDQVAELHKQVTVFPEQLKAIAQRDDDDLKELASVRAQMRSLAAAEPSKYPMPDFQAPNFHVTGDDLARNVRPWENATTELAPPTADMPK